MKHKFLLSLLVLSAAYSAQPARAIGITFWNQSQFSSVVNGVISTQVISGSPPANFTIHQFALPDKPSADASWQFVNTANTASFGGDFLLSSIGDTSGLSQTSVQSFLYFTLSEAVNYSVTGTLQLHNPDVESPYNAGGLGFNIGYGFAPGFNYGSGVQTNLAGDWHPPQLTGTFAPGNYTFSSQALAFFGGEASGAFSLVLTALNPPGAGAPACARRRLAPSHARHGHSHARGSGPPTCGVFLNASNLFPPNHRGGI
jgi:hypothetical protein